MKKTFLIVAFLILNFCSLYSQMSEPVNVPVTATNPNELALIEKKVNLLQAIVIVSFSVNIILSSAIIYFLQKKSNK